MVCFRGQAARHEGAGGRDDTATVLGQHRHLWRPAQYQVVPRVLQDIRVQRDGGHRTGGRRLQRQVSSVSATTSFTHFSLTYTVDRERLSYIFGLFQTLVVLKTTQRFNH